MIAPGISRRWLHDHPYVEGLLEEWPPERIRQVLDAVLELWGCRLEASMSPILELEGLPTVKAPAVSPIQTSARALGLQARGLDVSEPGARRFTDG